MIYRIIGRGGSGKTAFILEAIKKAHDEGKECIFLTPEQQSLHMEKELCAMLGSGYNITTEILNFERLPDRIFRENGGVVFSRADSKTLSLFTAIACQKAKEKLLTYENSALDRDFTKKISATIENLIPAVTCIFREGIDIAMNKFNPKKQKKISDEEI